jgi:hypothetical protein
MAVPIISLNISKPFEQSIIDSHLVWVKISFSWDLRFNNHYISLNSTFQAVWKTPTKYFVTLNWIISERSRKVSRLFWLGKGGGGHCTQNRTTDTWFVERKTPHETCGWWSDLDTLVSGYKSPPQHCTQQTRRWHVSSAVVDRSLGDTLEHSSGLTPILYSGLRFTASL